MEESNNVQRMPSVGLHTFLLVLGFACGVLWGALSIRPYKGMKRCIQDGDSFGAWDYAKKVKMFAFIGVGVNILFLLFSFMQR